MRLYAHIVFIARALITIRYHTSVIVYNKPRPYHLSDRGKVREHSKRKLWTYLKTTSKNLTD